MFVQFVKIKLTSFTYFEIIPWKLKRFRKWSGSICHRNEEGEEINHSTPSSVEIEWKMTNLTFWGRSLQYFFGITRGISSKWVLRGYYAGGITRASPLGGHYEDIWEEVVGIRRAPQSAYNGYRGSQVKSSGVNGVDVGGWKRLSEVAHCIFYAQCSTEYCSFVLERMSCLWNIFSGLCVLCYLSNACLTMSKLT